MSSIFDFDRPPDRYAVMGNPVGHSKSPRIHSLFARQTGQHMEYTAIQVDPGGFEQAVGNFAASGGRGLNVTVPFKEEAFRLVDDLTERAEAAGAVNTIVFEPGKSLGDNTDGVGLVRDIVQNNGGRLANRHILILGAGGAARGIIAPILQEHPASLLIANRTADKAHELAAMFASQGPADGGGFDRVHGQQFDFVINATAASLQQAALPLPNDILAPQGWCYDLMYGQATNAFSQWAHDCGAAQVLDGLGMLVEQAAESFYRWRGVRPESKPVLEILREEIQPH